MAKYVTLQALQTFYAGLKTKLNGKVNVEAGKGLSEINVTQTMVDGWNAAEKNIIVGIKTKAGEDGTATSVTIGEDRIATIILPSKYSDLTNDLTGDAALLTVGYYNSTIAPAIAAAADGKLTMKVVASIPASPEAKTIYLVPKTGTPDEGNIYDEYMVVTTGEGDEATNTLEKIGDTRLDLSDYVTFDDLAEEFVAVTTDEINAIFAEDEEDEEEGAGE